MKILKTIGDYRVVSLSDREMLDRNVDTRYAAVLKDEFDYPAKYRDLDMEFETLQEAIDFCL